MYFLMTVLEASGEGYLSFVEDGIQQSLVATSQPRRAQVPASRHFPHRPDPISSHLTVMYSPEYQFSSKSSQPLATM
jgi:hypothetical protein